jgi:hypothetical protein
LLLLFPGMFSIGLVNITAGIITRLEAETYWPYQEGSYWFQPETHGRHSFHSSDKHTSVQICSLNAF